MDNTEAYEKNLDGQKPAAIAESLDLLDFYSGANTAAKDSSGSLLPQLSISDSSQPVEKVSKNKDEKKAEKQPENPAEATANNTAENIAASLKLDNAENEIRDLLAKSEPSFAARFAEYSENFRTRAEAQGLDKAEQLDTYASLNKLLQEAKKDAPLSEQNRALIALEFMYHAADPSTVDQGDWNTCSVASIESRMFAKYPSRVADLVQQVALTGEYHAPDGKIINVGDSSVLSLWTAGPHPPLNGDRTLVSQLFQVTALNDLGQRGELGRYYGKTVHYVEAGSEAFVIQEGAAGPEPFYGNSSESIQKELSRLSGEKEPCVLINFDKDHGINDGVIHFKTEQEFQNELQKLKDKNELPAILSVYGNLPPFSDPDVRGHVVSISDLRQKPDGSFELYLDNQWGKGEEGADGWYSLNQIFLATRPA